MKKLLVVLLALGLIAAFGTASAADVKFSGQYYVTGQYENNRTLGDPDATTSLANFWQRARVKMDFKIAEGLSFTGRFDALEKAWGSITQSTAANADRSNSRTVAAGTTLQENIEFEQAYVTFKTAAGQFDVGYQAAEEWGTGFGDTPNSRPRIKLTSPVGPLTFLAIYEKEIEDYTKTAADGDKYMLAGIYKFKGGEAGLRYVLTDMANNRPTANFRTRLHTLAPYLKATFGPVYVEGEVIWLTGKSREFDSGFGADVDKEGLGAYAKAQMKFGPAYAGLVFGYSSGDDPATADKDESGPASSTSWSPGIIFGDANYKTWVGGSRIGGANGATFDPGAKQNLFAYGIFAGYNPTPKLNIEAQLYGYKADQVAANWDKDYGMEFDVTATYKIYDNLTYMVGAGYFWTGDYFKAGNANAKIDDDYVILNKLTLNF